MPDIAAAFKAEAARIARKETSTDIRAIRQLLASHRASIASLGKRVLDLERELKSTKRDVKTTQAEVGPEAAAQPESFRFRADGLAKHRQRLGLSAASAAVLMGVSPLTVYNWEAGKTRPRASQVPAIVQFRKLGKKDAVLRLEVMQAIGK